MPTQIKKAKCCQKHWSKIGRKLATFSTYIVSILRAGAPRARARRGRGSPTAPPRPRPATCSARAVDTRSFGWWRLAPSCSVRFRGARIDCLLWNAQKLVKCNWTMVVFFLNGDTGCIEEMRRNVFELWLSFFLNGDTGCFVARKQKILKGNRRKRFSFPDQSCFHVFSFIFLSINRSIKHPYDWRREKHMWN